MKSMLSSIQPRDAAISARRCWPLAERNQVVELVVGATDVVLIAPSVPVVGATGVYSSKVRRVRGTALRPSILSPAPKQTGAPSSRARAQRARGIAVDATSLQSCNLLP